jgi:hypothetical protein
MASPKEPEPPIGLAMLAFSIVCLGVLVFAFAATH